jgi:acetyltransferase-like isoleucine patch superfamily enzyme
MIFQLILIFFPWSFRRRLLIWRYGWVIDPSARIGISILLPRMLKMGPKSRIHNLVFCKRIDLVEMGEDSGIATGTFITGFATDNKHFFHHCDDRRCELILGRSAGITSRHFIDCNGGVYIGDFTTVAGIRTQILTHSIDVYCNRQDAKSIKIGKYCFIGSGCILLPGCVLPDYSILGAGAVLTKAYTKKGCLYAGSPAREVKELDIDSIPYFKREKHVVD